MFLLINGSLGPLLIGTAVATFFTGARFTLNDMNQVQWETGWHGLEAVLDIRNLALGFAVLFLVRLNGLLFIINTIYCRNRFHLWVRSEILYSEKISSSGGLFPFR